MRKRPSLTILSALAAILLCQSCAGLSRVEAPVREEPDRFVRVEARYPGGDKQGAARFDHPLVLSAREWTRILENVWVRHEPGVIALVSPQEPPVPAFTADEIAFLSKWLSKAFKHVHPDEWVVFGLSRRRSPELTEITTGGWFVEGDRLNLRLTNYRHVVSMAQVREQLWDDPLHSSGDRYYNLVPGDYQAATLVGGGPFGDLRGTSIPQLAIDYKGLLKPPSVAKPVPKSDAPPSAVVPEEGRGGDTAQKLRELKQLRDDGTITEEEYRTKKKQLLDRY
jgi:hypothetical protein